VNDISRSLAVLSVCYIVLALESPLLQELHLSFFAPDLALIAVVWIALHMNPVPGILTCFFLGYLKDGFVMGAPVGMHMEIFVAVYYVVRFLAARMRVRGMVTLIVTTFVASMMASSLFALLSLLFDSTFTDFGLIFRFMIPVALVTAPFAPVMFYILDKVDNVFFRKGSDSLFFN